MRSWLKRRALPIARATVAGAFTTYAVNALRVPSGITASASTPSGTCTFNLNTPSFASHSL